jgi:hypothetical protein
MTTLTRICVFCGKKPKTKNKEHIIPQWLIKYTGDPNRKAFFGFDFVSEKPSMRTYAFDSFSFPACIECNSEFSILETMAQSVVTSIIDEREVDSRDINILLDWLDKIRVGLWLGFLYLNKGFHDVSPKYYIKTRMTARDRFVILYKVMNKRPGINFIGTESPGFLFIPSCFALVINNYCFFNGSNVNLLDRRLGFPYAREAFYTGVNYQVEFDLVRGLERKYFPVIRKAIISGGSRFYQPIFREQMQFAKILYDNPYVRENSLDWDSGIGKIFRETDKSIETFSELKTKAWIPDHAYSLSEIISRINKHVYDMQVYIGCGLASTAHLTSEEKQEHKQHLNFIKSANRWVIEMVNEQLRNLGENN